MGVSELISQLDRIVPIEDECARCHQVKDLLEEVVREGLEIPDSRFFEPAQGCYARRLLHKDPKGLYSVLVMVWDQGQGTALHDHAGCWCVECVYRGQIKVVSYDLKGDPCADRVQFEQETTIYAGPGEAGALIPPFEYHTLENAEQTPAITLHVYGGELTWCHAFVPEEDGYRRVRRELKYTP